jgi:polar amino acid transport system substrate-binding protein
VKFLSVVLCTLVFALTGGAVTAYAKCNSLKIAYAHNWVPVSYRDEDQKAQGLAIAVQKLIFNQLGYSVEFIGDLPWKRQLAMLSRGHIDAIAAIQYNEERAQQFILTEPFYLSETQIYKRVESPLVFTELKDLVPFSGVVPKGASFGTEFDEYRAKYLDIFDVLRTTKIIDLLTRGRADYTILPKDLGNFMLKLNSAQEKVVITGPPLIRNPVQMAFSKNSQCLELLPKINGLIKKLRQDGTLKKILNTYIDTMNSY